MSTQSLFSLQNKVAIVTGATGVLGGAIAHGLADAGATVGILGRRAERAGEVAETIRRGGGKAFALPADVLEQGELAAARDTVMQQHGHIDILVNCAGGHVPDAIIYGERTFFNMPRDAFEQVVALNLTGSVLPTQCFGQAMLEGDGSGSVINISSMTVDRAITRAFGYGVGKAGIDNFTRWLATELGLNYGGRVRVNAIAPGFFVGDQNRDLLLNPDGTFTDRGRTIVNSTPMGRFGEPDELIGTAVWLASDASRFVTGIVVPVDGGFSAFSGV